MCSTRAPTEALVDWVAELLAGNLSTIRLNPRWSTWAPAAAPSAGEQHACRVARAQPRRQRRRLDWRVATASASAAVGLCCSATMSALRHAGASGVEQPALHSPPTTRHLPALRHEPPAGADARRDGLAAIDALIAGAGDHLLGRRLAAAEHGHDRSRRAPAPGVCRLRAPSALATTWRVTSDAARHAPLTAGAGLSAGSDGSAGASGAPDQGYFSPQLEPTGGAEDYDARKGRCRPHRPSPRSTGKGVEDVQNPLVCLLALLGASAAPRMADITVEAPRTCAHPNAACASGWVTFASTWRSASSAPRRREGACCVTTTSPAPASRRRRHGGLR